jgi:Carboxypeptidase regulatory-like domain
MRRLTPLALLAGLLTVLLAAPAFAQRQLGAIQGTIVDATGGVLPGVAVTATNKSTGEVRTTVTNEAGIYRLQSLDPGTYDVSAQLSGLGRADDRTSSCRLARRSGSISR